MNKSYLIIGVLVVTAVILLGAITMRLTTTNKNPAGARGQLTPGNSQAPENTAQVASDSALLAHLSDDQRAVLDPQKAGIANDQDKYSKLLNTLAKEADAIDLKACISDPVIARHKLKTPLTVKNSDKVAHTIQFRENLTETIEPNRSKVVDTSFATGNRSYAYNCDKSPVSVGMVYFYQ